MRVRWLYLMVGLIAAAVVPRYVARADLNYQTEITGVEDSELSDLLEKVSELKTLENRPPVSLGYWDTGFFYDINAEADPAKITLRWL